MAGRFSKRFGRGEDAEGPEAGTPAPDRGANGDSTEVQPIPEEYENKGRGDTQERIRVAAEEAADAAEQRSIEEILALEEDLKAAEERAAEAEGRASQAEGVRAGQEAIGREAAAEWLRGQVTQLQRDAERSAEEQVRQAQRDAEEQVRAAKREADERIRAIRRGKEPAAGDGDVDARAATLAQLESELRAREAELAEREAKSPGRRHRRLPGRAGPRPSGRRSRPAA